MHPALTAVFVILGILVLLALLYLLALRTETKRERKSATRLFTEKNYAHRGLFGGEIPENSLSAFDAACCAGYGIELDVALSKDGVPMIFHDATLDRMCGVSGKVGDYTKEELQSFALDGRPEHKIPTLAEALACVSGRVPLIVEFKLDASEKPHALCEAAMALLDGYTGEYCMESFNSFAVHWFRKNRPHIIRGQLSDAFHKRKTKYGIGQFIVESLCFNFLCRPDFIAFHFKHPRHLPLLLARGLYRTPTFAWTPRNDEEVREALSHFDAVIFESATPPQRNKNA